VQLDSKNYYILGQIWEKTNHFFLEQPAGALPFHKEEEK
jgi:hypothetical protein